MTDKTSRAHRRGLQIAPERAYQNALKKLFCGKGTSLGYDFDSSTTAVGTNGINEASAAYGQVAGPIEVDDLRKWLRLNQYTTQQIEGAVRQLSQRARLTHVGNQELMQRNNDCYELLIQGVDIPPEPDLAPRNVQYFDFLNPWRNQFTLREEVSFQDPLTRQISRPDLVVYVNGIALAVIELKRASVDDQQARAQHISNMCDLIPSFFTTTQFVVAASDGGQFLYSTILTPAQFWCHWLGQDNYHHTTTITDREAFSAFFDKATFLFLVRYGVLNQGGRKLVMRPHQYYALRAAQPRLLTKESGIIWHSQGSGKSLTMIWLARYIKANFSNPRLLIITDRKELDAQLRVNFQSSLHPDSPERLRSVSSKEDLFDALQDGSCWMVSTLIHKFGFYPPSSDEQRSSLQASRQVAVPLARCLEELTAYVRSRRPNFRVAGENIFVFIDECHRTQGGKLHEAMRALLGQEVMLIGFTGTPLMANESHQTLASLSRVSTSKFGPYIHTYLSHEAIRDGVILDLRYEARDVEQTLTDQRAIDQRFEELTHDQTARQRQQFTNRWATLQKVYSASSRIEKIAYSILDDVEHHEQLRAPWCNALLVCGSIDEAYKYYELFQTDEHFARLRDRTCVVTSYWPTSYDLRKERTDPAIESDAELRHRRALLAAEALQAESPEQYEEKAKQLFLNTPDRMKLMIVVNRMLTGFDAPSCTLIYLDREMRDQTLYQAICRVNRLGPQGLTQSINGHQVPLVANKDYGLVVDFKHLFASIAEATAQFNPEAAFGGLSPLGNTQNPGPGQTGASNYDMALAPFVVRAVRSLELAAEAYNALRATWEQQGLMTANDIADHYVLSPRNPPATAAALEEADRARQAVYQICGRLVGAYNNLASYTGPTDLGQEQMTHYEQLAREAANIKSLILTRSGDFLDYRLYDAPMRQLLDRFLQANEAEHLASTPPDYSFLRPAELTQQSDEQVINRARALSGDDEGMADLIAGAVTAAINDSRGRDTALFEQLSAKLLHLLEELRQRRADFLTQMRELLSLARQAQGQGRRYPPALEGNDELRPLRRALWNARDSLGLDIQNNAVGLIAELSEFVDNEAPADYHVEGSNSYYVFRTNLHTKLGLMGLAEERYEDIYNIIINNHA